MMGVRGVREEREEASANHVRARTLQQAASCTDEGG